MMNKIFIIYENNAFVCKIVLREIKRVSFFFDTSFSLDNLVNFGKYTAFLYPID